MTTRAYIRESTIAQGEKFGPDAQRAAIDRACDDLKIARAQLWYADLITGTGKVVRDGLAHARADAKAHEYDVLVCYDTSRWARNEEDAFAFEREMRLAGVRIYYAAERIWADDATTALHKGVLHVINAEYSRTLARKIRDGYAAKKAKGGHVGGVPWGYRRSADTMTLVPIPELVAVRLLAYSLYATGEHTFATVADELSRRGHRIYARGAERAITRFTVSEILSKDLDLRYGGLDRAIYDRVLELRERHKINEHVGQRTHTYVFAGLARCAECGESFHARTQTLRGETRRQLYHSPRGCRRGARDEISLEVQLGRWMQTWKLRPDAPARISRYLQARRDRPENISARRGLESELERLRNLYRWGDISEAEYQRERTRLQHALAGVAPEVLARPVTAEAMQYVERLGEAWIAADVAARRTFARTVFSEIRLHRSGRVEVGVRAELRELVFEAGSAPWAVLDERPRWAPRRRRDGSVGVLGLEDWLAFWAAEASA
jgi:site-specific DNA recombinase